MGQANRAETEYLDKKIDHSLILGATGCSSHHRWLLFAKRLAGNLVGFDGYPVLTLALVTPPVSLALEVSGIPRKVNTIYLEHIAQNTQPQSNLLKNTAAATQVRNVSLKASS